MTVEFWIGLLSSTNVTALIAIVIAETIAIIILARYYVKLVNKLIEMTEKMATILERISTDYRQRDK